MHVVDVTGKLAARQLKHDGEPAHVCGAECAGACIMWGLEQVSTPLDLGCNEL